MSLPLLRLSGRPYEQGLEHGHRLRDSIAHNLAVYFERFESEAGLARSEVARRSGVYLGALQATAADYVAGMQGIADGSGFDLQDVVALNVRYELIYCQVSAMAMAEGCTSFAVLPERSVGGHLLMGQNWDWIPEVKGTVVHTREEGGQETLSFTEAGIFGGKIGLNSAGVGLAVNGMLSTEDDWTRLSRPFHVRCFEILRARSLPEAVDVIARERRACAANFLISDAASGAVDVEAAPDRMRAIEPQTGWLAHTNHFFEPHLLGTSEPPNPRRKYSFSRCRRISALLDSTRPADVSQLQAILRDHHGRPNSLCRHPDLDFPPAQRHITVTSVIMDLHERRMWITDGQPCRSPYDELAL
jgi:isopenicillin-N N-acyltransferase-like protein